MNKYEFTLNCQGNNALGLISDIECLNMIVDKWTEDNDGRMDTDQLTEMAEYLERIEWYCMASMMHGYFWGASTDNEWELKGEQLRKVIFNH